MKTAIPLAAILAALACHGAASAADPNTADRAAAEASSAASDWRLVTSSDTAFGFVDVGGLEVGPAGERRVRTGMILRKSLRDAAIVEAVEEFRCDVRTGRTIELKTFDQTGTLLSRTSSKGPRRAVDSDSRLAAAFKVACGAGLADDGKPGYGSLVDARHDLLIDGTPR